MPKFLCWQESHGGPETGREHDAGNARLAAEKYAAWHDGQALEYPPDREVSVRDQHGAVEVFVVTMRAVPEYTARTKRRK